MNDDKATQWLTKADGLARRWEQARGDRPALPLAKELDWSSSKVTRIEQGTQVPSHKDIEDWSRVCGLNEVDTRKLTALLDEFIAIRPVLRQRTRRAEKAAPADASGLVETSTLIRTYSSWAVPPILQLEEYASVVLAEQERFNPGAGADPADALTARMRRQPLLFDKTRRFEMLIDESVLYRRHGGADVLRDQLQFLLQRLNGLAKFGIVPFDAPVAAPAVESLAVYDEQAFLERITGDELADPAELGLCTRLLERLWPVAAEKAAARRLIERALAALDS